jgi:DNA-3-methyladenine glycosylase II
VATTANGLPDLHTLQPAAQDYWRSRDAPLHRLSAATPLPAERVIDGTDPFAALVTSITHQQVSLAAGTTIHGRLVKALGGKVTPRRVLSRSTEQLRAAGLSRGKTAYIQDLAAKTQAGEVEFDRFPRMEDAAIIEELVAVKGIGVWTAKMFLIFHLKRPDVSAPEDLGLQIAAARAFRVPQARAAKLLERKAESWSPYNSVANLVLWESRRIPEGS